MAVWDSTLEDLVRAQLSNHRGLVEVTGGKIISGKFVPGLEYTEFKQIYSDMALTTVANPHHWTVQVERSIQYVYAENVKLTVKENGSEYSKHITKSEIMISVKQRNYVYRVTCYHECSTARSMEPPVMTRLHETYTHIYKDGFKYKLEKLCTGTSKEEACSNQPTFSMSMILPVGVDVSPVMFLNRVADISGRYSEGGLALDTIMQQM